MLPARHRTRWWGRSSRRALNNWHTGDRQDFSVSLSSEAAGCGSWLSRDGGPGVNSLEDFFDIVGVKDHSGTIVAKSLARTADFVERTRGEQIRGRSVDSDKICFVRCLRSPDRQCGSLGCTRKVLQKRRVQPSHLPLV